MHTKAIGKYVDQSQQLRLNLDLGISNQQPDNDIAKETNLQMPGKNCKNIQHRRGRRRRHEHGHREGGGDEIEKRIRGGFVGIFWSINLAILICLAHSTNAVPTDNSGNSNSNSNSDNIAFSTVSLVAVTPSSIISSGGGSSTESLLEQQQPQGQCLLDGLWVSETTVHCEKQTSCRAIQRTGHCCPDYKCDCEKDGKTYANGYKLVDPDTPCTVCYCKGGEIVCSSVTCFRRDDCMPKYVAGRCCPEYDNCPILDNNPSLGGETSNVATTTTKAAPVAPPAGFNWNITIKEITKPTEIRITDDNHKVKQTIPTRKVASTEAPTTAAAAISTTSTAATTVASESKATTEAATSTEATATTAAAGVTTTAMSPTTDAPATPTSSLLLSQDTNQKALPVNSSESLKLIASVAYNSLGPQQKPLITYNADGLQPLAENDPSKVNIKREYTTDDVGGATSKESVPLGISSTFIQNGFRDALVDSGAAVAELEPDTAGSDNIYHIISTTEGPSRSSSTERQLTTDGPTPPSSEMSSTYSYENSTTEMELSTEGLAAVSSTESSIASSTQTVHHMEEEDVPQVESNPAYPSLPEDDFSLRDVNFPLVELEDIVEPENKDEQRSIVSAFERDNKRTKLVTESSLDTSGSGNGSGSGDMELYQPLPSPSYQMQAQGSSLSQVPLMYSAEDNSSETRIQNVSDLAKIMLNHSENDTSGELESGSGSGSGELREPTTPKTTYVPVQDIDELGSGAEQAQQSTVQDPKADAESLKLNESQEQTAGENKATSRAEKSFVEESEAGAGQRLERLYLKRIY